MSAIAAEDVSKHWTTRRGQGPRRRRHHLRVRRRARSTCCSARRAAASRRRCASSPGSSSADGGRVLIGGRDVTDLPPAQRNIAMVFQSYALFPHLSVAENIVFGLQGAQGRAGRRRRAARRASPSCWASSKLLDRKPGQLSGGQQQRVALGRAIIAEAPVCLMDEPLSNLDAQLRQEMRARDPRAAAEARHHDGLRHARPGRGDVHGRPGGAAARRAHRAERDAGRALRARRPTPSPRASSARRR